MLIQCIENIGKVETFNLINTTVSSCETHLFTTEIIHLLVMIPEDNISRIASFEQNRSQK